MMNSCEPIRNQMMFYLDNELHGDEQQAVEDHLRLCAACRRLCEEEKALPEIVRSAAPLYAASEDLRGRVAALLDDAPASHRAPANLRQRLHKTLGRDAAGHTGSPLFNRRSFAIAAMLLLAVFAGVIYLTGNRRTSATKQPSAFALMAATTHQKHLHEQLPFEVISDSPERISNWFAGKVSFGFKLPNYQEVSGQEKLYKLEGARLVAFNNDYAAYVGYQMNRRPISLVVTSNTVAMPEGGEEILSKGLTFHYDTIDGWKVITWADRGLTYALVSDLEERGQQSCIVCHAGTRDRDFIESLRPSK